MDMVLRGLRKRAATVIVFYSILYYLCLLLFPSAQIVLSDLFSVIGELAAVTVIALAFRLQTKEYRITWIAMLAGVASYLLGDVLWSVKELLFHQEVPFPSICDVFYLISSLIFIVGFFLYIRRENPFLFVRTGFDVLITMVIGATLIWKFELIPISQDFTLSMLQKIVSVSYPIFDLAFLGGIFSLFFFFSSKIRINAANLLLSAAFLLMVIADQIYLTDVFSEYVSGGLLDPMWPISLLLIALAALWPPYKTEKSPIQAIKLKKSKFIILEYFRFLLPYLGACFLVILASYEYLTRDPLIVGIIISGMLVMIRQIFTLLENQRLMSLVQEANRTLEENKTALEKQNFELRRLSKLSEYEANTDFLTGLFNRRYIYRYLRSFSKLRAHEKIELSVLLIDVDQFKQINDTYGHERGDAALKMIGQVIRASIRSSDMAARFGGDEFIIVLPNADSEFMDFMGHTLLEQIRELRCPRTEESISVTVSIGGSRWAGNARTYDINRIVTDADKALYEAKSAGRNCLRLSNFPGGEE